MGLKNTYVFCEFLHNCVQVTPEFGSKDQSYFIEIFTSSRTFISHASRCHWIQFALYLWHKLIPHPLHRIQKNSQLKKTVPPLKKVSFLGDLLTKLNHTKNLSTLPHLVWKMYPPLVWQTSGNIWKALWALNCPLMGITHQSIAFPTIQKLSSQYLQLPIEEGGRIPLQILDEFLVRQRNIKYHLDTYLF